MFSKRVRIGGMRLPQRRTLIVPTRKWVAPRRTLPTALCFQQCELIFPVRGVLRQSHHGAALSETIDEVDGPIEAVSLSKNDIRFPTPEEFFSFYRERYPEYTVDDGMFRYTGFRLKRGPKQKKYDVYTAHFTCPATGQVYDSGTLQTGATTKDIEGSVTYRKPSLARQAVMARAMDQISYRERNVTEPRLCIEDPSLEIQNTRMLEPTQISEDKPSQPLPAPVIDEKDARLFYERGMPPLWKLDNWYRRLYPSYQSSFEGHFRATGYWEQSTDTDWFTATFICPITGQVYESGALRDVSRSGEPHSFEGKRHYAKLNWATQAAAARVIDHISYRERGVKEPRLCEEDPADLVVNDATLNLHTMVAHPDSDPLPTPATAASPSAPLFSDQTFKWELHSWYTRMYPDYPFDKHTFGSEKITSAGRNWYTATFTCPITGQVYEAGSLRSENESDTVHIADEKCYYSRAKLAIQAVSARVLDQISYRLRNETEARLCVEDPASLVVNNATVELYRLACEESDQEAGIAVPRASEEAPELSQDEVGETVASQQSSDRKGETVAKTRTPETVASPKTRTPVSIRAYDIEEDDEVYTIQNLTGTGISEEKTTLERVLEAWADNMTEPTTKFVENTLYPMSSSLTQQKRRAVSDTTTMYDQMRGQGERAKENEKHGEQYSQTFQHQIFPVSLTAGNVMLEALANANDIPSKNMEVNESVENTATQILDFLWTCPAQERPTADSYNAYLQCLVRTDPADAATRAEAFLTAMTEGQEIGGRKLPEPNIGTYNSVMKLWANAGGRIGYKKCEELMLQLLQKSNVGSGLQPSRDTFLIMLNSMANAGNEPKLFDKDKALEWIERMRTYAVSHKDNTMIPDVQVYNAPLYWNGGFKTVTSNPLTAMRPWDAYHQIFGNGLISTTETENREEHAQQVQEWLDYMQAKTNVSPNIETYEAVIQAWVRTGTKEGLKKAEAVALQAIESDSKESCPRLQTFHPIIAALAYSGDGRAPKKIKYRLDRLNEMSSSNPELTPDGRMQLALITAWRSYQRRLIYDNAVGSDISSREELVSSLKSLAILPKLIESAQACTGVLDNMCVELKQTQEGQNSRFLEASAFVQVASAWSRVARHSCQLQGAADEDLCPVTQEAVAAVLGTAKSLEESIQLLREDCRERESVSANDDEDIIYAEDDRQLRHFMICAHKVYLEALTLVNEIDSMDFPDAEEAHCFRDHLNTIELLLRRSEEYRRLLHQPCTRDDRGKHPDSTALHDQDDNIVYSDLYAYHPQVSSYDLPHPEAHIALYLAAVEGCRHLLSSEGSSSSLGDSVRLCVLVLEHVRHWTGDSGTALDLTPLFESLVSVFGAVPDEHDRSELFGVVLDTVNEVSRNKRVVVKPKIIFSGVDRKAIPPPRRQRWRNPSPYVRPRSGKEDRSRDQSQGLKQFRAKDREQRLKQYRSRKNKRIQAT